MAADQVEVLMIVVAALEKLNIAYVVGGSFASSAHGIARATMDIDLLAEVRPEHARPFAAQLEAEFYADEQAIERAARTRRSFNVIHLGSMFKVDIFVAKGTEFQQKQLERRRLEVVSKEPERRAYVATPEDVVLAKLDWYRRGNEVSDQQWRDVIGVLDVQSGKLDIEYLRHWAQDLGVADLLEEALEESRQKN